MLLECAWFEPARIGETGRRHSINTDARARFERGVDPMKLSIGIESAAQMILDLCGGEVSEPRVSGEAPADAYPNRDNIVTYRPQRLADLGGIELEPERQAAILARLEFFRLDPDDSQSWLSEAQRREMVELAASAPRETWLVRAPTWRPDVDGEADIVEEIARIHGFEHIPSTPLERAAGRGKGDSDEGAVDRTPGAPRGGCARARRGGHLELHFGRRSGGVRGRRLDAAKSDQRRDEGDAPVAAAGADRRRRAATSTAGNHRCGCSRSGGAIWPTASIRRWRCCLPGKPGRAAGRAARRKGSTRSMPRRKRLLCWKRLASRPLICRLFRTPARPGIPAGRRPCGWGRRPCWRPSANCTRAWWRGSMRRLEQWPPKSTSMRSPTRGRAGGHAQRSTRRRCSR